MNGIEFKVKKYNTEGLAVEFSNGIEGDHTIWHGIESHCVAYLTDKEAWKLGQFISLYYKEHSTSDVSERFQKYTQKILSALDERKIVYPKINLLYEAEGKP